MTEKIKLDFNEPHISYKNSKGEKVVGVTTALGLLNKPALVIWAYNKGLNNETLYEKDEAGNIGTITHARILAYFKGYEIDNCNISPEAWDYSTRCLDSFFEYIKGKKIEPVVVEEPMISEKYQYGGTPDMFGIVDGRHELWDFKSGSGIYETHIYQLKAYAQLIIEADLPAPERIVALNIPKSSDDSFAVQSINSEYLNDEFQIFLNLKEIYYLQKGIKLRKKGKFIKSIKGSEK